MIGGGQGARPAGPESKTQQPLRRFTPAELLALKNSGALDTAAGLGTQRPGGARPGAPTGPRPGLPAAPGVRRPLPGAAPGVAPPAPVAPPTTEEDEERRGAVKGGRLGTPADRAGRRAKRNERATERGRVNSPLPASVLLNESDEDGRRSRSGGRKHKAGHRGAALAPTKKGQAQVEPPVTVRSLSEAIGIPAKDLIKRMMIGMGLTVNINATLEDEAAQMLSLEFGVELEILHEVTAEDELLASWDEEEADDESLLPRPPVITILGHVDHGKTSLLDRIRKANVVATESGGITQHIGAYTVAHGAGSITFVDTPGHEAFTAMRARGANVTDIVVLVVAADDGVMPQTQEAIAHAKAAEVPIIVALNKIDLPNVNINKIFGELSQQGLVPEEYGGETPVVKTSALTGQGVDDLLDMLQLVADLHAAEMRANPAKPAKGTCLEASISEGRGVVATVLVQDGTLRVGDAMVCGDGYGRVRALFDDKGRSVAEAGPSTPVEVSGLDAVPTAGEKFAVVDDIAQAREIAETRRSRTRGASLGERQAVTLENLYSRMAEQKVKSLNLILKADVQGSLEALGKELEKLENDEVPIRILFKGVGGVTERDVLLADASQAVVIGFRVAPDDQASNLADEKKIEIRRYDIIYQVTDEIRKALEGMLVPEFKEVHLGRAVVRQVFKISKVGAVAGCFVTQGTIERAAKARLIREGREIYKGTIQELKRFKDDVKEVREGFECGIKISNFDDLKIDDVIEAYRIDEIRRTL
jgi:translation initiation factor IF-2